MSVKIFQIGYNKCGTTTLYWFFHNNGVPGVHHLGGELARNFEARMQKNEDPFADYPDTTFFSDIALTTSDKLIDGADHFEYIYKFYPDGLYILNTRDLDAWINSRLGWTNYKDRYRNALGLKDNDELVARWRADWEQHHARVKEFFKDKPGQLVIFDIEQDSPEKLVEFFKPHFNLDPAHYEVKNVTALVNARLTAKKAERQAIRAARAGGKGSVKRAEDRSAVLKARAARLTALIAREEQKAQSDPSRAAKVAIIARQAKKATERAEDAARQAQQKSAALAGVVETPTVTAENLEQKRAAKQERRKLRAAEREEAAKSAGPLTRLRRFLGFSKGQRISTGRTARG